MKEHHKSEGHGGTCDWRLDRATHLVASLQVLHFVGKFLGLAMTLMLKLLHSPLDLLVQLLQLFNVALEFFQQPITEERETVKNITLVLTTYTAGHTKH